MISMIFSWDLVSISLFRVFSVVFVLLFYALVGPDHHYRRRRRRLPPSFLLFFYAIPIYSSDPPLLYIYSCVRPWQSTQVWFPSGRCNVVVPLSPYTSYLRRYHGRLKSLFPRTRWRWTIH